MVKVRGRLLTESEKNMRIWSKATLLIFLIVFPVDSTFLTGQSSAQVLLHQSDLVYQGAFRVPTGKLGANQAVGFAFGGAALAYNPANNSLFVVGPVFDQMTGEIG